METLIKYNIPEKNAPQLTVVIPTYEPHHQYLQQALDSIQFDLAEVIIVNDSDIPLEAVGNNIRILNKEPDVDRKGTGWARNMGAAFAATDLLLWLDSDDMFLPNGVRLLYEAQRATVTSDNPDGLIVYGGFLRGLDNAYWSMSDQYCGSDIRQTGLFTPAMPYCILIPKSQHDLIGGYDEVMPTWEDIDYEKRITINGLCARRINSAIFWYRWESGTRRNLSADTAIHKQVSNHMYNRYKDYSEGRKQLMPCVTCGDQPQSPYKSSPITNSNHKTGQLPQNLSKNEQLYLIYKGESAVHPKTGPHTGFTYRWGRSSRLAHYKKRVVDRIQDLASDEVNRLDAQEFITQRRQGHGYEFKYEVEVVVGSGPTPLPPKRAIPESTVTRPPAAGELDLGFIFETNDPVSDYSIPKMEKKLAEEDVPKAKLQIWLEQEKRSEKPRSGMLDVLNEALAAI